MVGKRHIILSKDDLMALVKAAVVLFEHEKQNELMYVEIEEKEENESGHSVRCLRFMAGEDDDYESPRHNKVNEKDGLKLEAWALY